MALMPVPPGEIVSVVTTLEMQARPRPAPMPDSPLRLVRWDQPDTERYRAIFRMVGEMGIGRVVRHAGSRGRSIMKPAQQQDEQHQEAERSAGHPRAPNSE